MNKWKHRIKAILMGTLLFILTSGMNVNAATVVDFSQLNPAWQSQILSLDLNDTSFPVYLGQIGDSASLDTYLNQVNGQLAGYVYEQTDAVGNVQKQCYQLNDEFRSWLITALQARMMQPVIDNIHVNLQENHLKIVTLSISIADPASYVVAGGCETSYKTSSSNRCNNIAVAAERLNGLVVAPGQVVSVSDMILPRTRANGYLEAGAYVDGKTVPALGGGICQVSSTVYNAAMNAGLTVVERHQHSMPVHYLPLGVDAAISQGTMDMRFRNDYNTPIIIQTQTNNKKLTVTVSVNALSLQGRSYKLWAKQTGGLSATSYLTTYVNNVELQTVKVASSSYRAPKAEDEE